MMNHRVLIALSLTLLLAACGGSDRPTYFGHQGSTEGMPGYVNGEKTNPNIKLGKPYRVGGQTYIPTYDPNYNEVGMASWYGPGFHGGRTANGEEFDKYAFTAAHTTLPLPSVVRVTNLKNGRQVYVRINDRGPFAEGRIIDLSKAAAEHIDLVRQGVGKVRVEYMREESQRVVDLMNRGRDPASIDLAGEIMGRGRTQVAAHNVSPPSDKTNWWEYVNPIPTAHAQEPTDDPLVAAVPQDEMDVQELAPVYQQPPTEPMPHSTFTPAALPEAQAVEQMPAPTPVGELPLSVKAMEITGPVPVVATRSYYVQLGSFSVQANAESLKSRLTAVGPVLIEPATGPNGNPVYRVRMGPFASAAEAESMLTHAKTSGAGEGRIIKP